MTLSGFTLFDFNNDPNLNNLTVNVSILDEAGTLASTLFSTLYKNTSLNASIKIVQNGIVVYDKNDALNHVCQLAAVRVRPDRCHKDDHRLDDHNVPNHIAGDGTNTVQAICISNTWIVGG